MVNFHDGLVHWQSIILQYKFPENLKLDLNWMSSVLDTSFANTSTIMHHDRVTSLNSTFLLIATDLFLANNVVIRVEVRWCIRCSKNYDKVSNQYLTNGQIK